MNGEAASSTRYCVADLRSDGDVDPAGLRAVVVGIWQWVVAAQFAEPLVEGDREHVVIGIRGLERPIENRLHFEFGPHPAEREVSPPQVRHGQTESPTGSFDQIDLDGHGRSVSGRSEATTSAAWTTTATPDARAARNSDPIASSAPTRLRAIITPCA